MHESECKTFFRAGSCAAFRVFQGRVVFGEPSVPISCEMFLTFLRPEKESKLYDALSQHTEERQHRQTVESDLLHVRDELQMERKQREAAEYELDSLHLQLSLTIQKLQTSKNESLRLRDALILERRECYAAEKQLAKLELQLADATEKVEDANIARLVSRDGLALEREQRETAEKQLSEIQVQLENARKKSEDTEKLVSELRTQLSQAKHPKLSIQLRLVNWEWSGREKKLLRRSFPNFEMEYKLLVMVLAGSMR